MKNHTKSFLRKIVSVVLSGVSSVSLLATSVPVWANSEYEVQQTSIESEILSDEIQEKGSQIENEYNPDESYFENEDVDESYLYEEEYMDDPIVENDSNEEETNTEEYYEEDSEDFIEEEPILVENVTLSSGEIFEIKAIISEQNTVTVKWSAPNRAMLEVTVWNEADPTDYMMQSASIDIANEEHCNQFVYEDLPKYYYIVARLLNDDGNELCEPFIERRYTESIQALANANYEDYDADLTIPLFTNEEGFTSFVVMAESAKVLYTDAHNITYTESDDLSEDEYFLTTDSSYVLGVEEGDIIALIDDKDRELYCGPLVELDEATGLPLEAPGTEYYDFNFFKVDRVSTADGGILLTAEDADETNLEEIFQMVVVRSGNSGASDFSGETTLEKEISFGYEAEGLYGEGTLKMDISYELYIDARGWRIREAYFSLRDDYRLEDFTVQIKITGEKSFLIFEVPLGEPGVADVALKIKFVVSAEVTGSVSFNIVGTFGGTIGTKDESFTDGPNFEFNKFELQGKLFAGIGIGVFVDLLFFEFGIQFVPGFEATGALTAGEEGSSTTPWHLCESMKCLQGDISSVVNFVMSADLKFKEFSKTIPINPQKITDYYWSWTYDTHDWTECPYKGYQLNVTVLSKDKKEPVADVDISYSPMDEKYKRKGSGTTDEHGKVTLYVPADEHEAITVTAQKKLPGGTDSSNIYKLIKTKEKQDIEIILNTTENYDIFFDSNKPKQASHSTSGTMNRIEAIYGDTFNLPKNGYSLPGWTFAGWNTKPDGSGIYVTDEASVSNKTFDAAPKDTITLYATWTPNEYKITYQYMMDEELKTEERIYYYDIGTGLYNYQPEGTIIWKRADVFGGKKYQTGKIYTNLCSMDKDGKIY